MRKTLSVALATYNEEKNLAACLESFKDIADEIVIVDGTSTDKTVEIAKKFGARVKVTTNKPNFHINKQMAIQMAKSDWILQMDADEHVSDEMKKEIKDILENDPKEFNGYWMPRKNWFLGRFLLKGGQYPDYTLRLYRRGKGRLPMVHVHEQAEVIGKVGYLKSALLHYPYASLKHYIKKWDFYNNIFATQIKDQLKGKNIFQKLFFTIMNLFVLPSHWLLTTFFRHKGFMDSWQGFTFSLFSALRFPASYIKYLGWYKFWFIVIIIVSAVIRFYNFPDRWGLSGDDGRDAMVALEALRRFELPLMGPFSSAGPFVFGGIYYWFIMAAYGILPFMISAPWIFLEILSVITVGLLMYLGKIIKGEKFSVIIGILALTSPQLVVRSLSLGPHTFIATFTALVLIFFVLLWQKKKLLFAFLMGIFIGLGISFHYQAVNLLIFLPAVFIITSLSFKKRIISFILVLLGFLIPSLPLLYWDYFQNFANTKNILDYLLIAQYRIYVPNSWKLFIFNYVPYYWGFVAGNFSIVGFLLLTSSFLVFLFSLLKKNISLIFKFIGFIFMVLLFVNRFYKGERSEGYLLYFLPFILLFTALLIDEILNFKNRLIKSAGMLILVAIIIFNAVYIINVLNFKTIAKDTKVISKLLSDKYPNTKFSIYDFKYKMYTASMPLSLRMSFEGKIDPNGKRIGISCYGKGCPKGLPVINEGFYIVDLSKVKRQDFERKIWINVNQVFVYDDLIGWLSKNQLKSNFSLIKYIKDAIKI